MTTDEALDIILALARRELSREAIEYMPRVHEAFEIVINLKSKPVTDLERRIAYFEQCIASFKGDMS